MKVIEQKTLFVGRRISLRQDRLLRPDGRETVYDVVVHPGAVCILARPTPDTVVLIRQYRPATGEELIELPAGTLEAGEDPADTARRELEEETGYVAAGWTPRAQYYTAPGFTNELMYLYEATGLALRAQRLDEEEAIEVIVVGADEAMTMVRQGRIRDAKTLIGLLLAFGHEPPAEKRT